MAEFSLRALIQRLLGNTVVEDRSNEGEAERRLRLAFGSPGISNDGVFTFTYQPIFGSTGFYVDVRAKGAVGDGVTDDTAAIAAAIAAAGSGGVVYFPPGKTFKVTTSLTMTADDQVWLMHGATIGIATATFAGITIGTSGAKVRRGRIYGGIVQPLSGSLDWTAGGCGYRLFNANNCVLWHVSSRWGEKGIEVTCPTGGQETTQNWITPLMVADCALPIRLYADSGGSVNENTFTGGEVSYSGSCPNATTRFAVTIDRHASANGTVNGIKFRGTYFGCSMSANKPTLASLNAVGSSFDSCHAEGFPLPLVVNGADALTGGVPNFYFAGGADWTDPEADLSAGGAGTAAPWFYVGRDGGGIAGGFLAGSDYVWRVKQLGTSTKVGLSVADSTNTENFSVTGAGVVVAAGNVSAGGNVVSGTNSSGGNVIVNGPAASNRTGPLFRTAGSNRWDIRANNTAEGGANAGSDLAITAYDDSGNSLGTALTVTRASRAATFANAVKSSSATAGIGYATGAGGTVTQATSKSTAVSLNTVTGLITMNNAALAAGAIVSFTLNDTAIVATDLILAMHESGGTTGAYTINARATGSGTAAFDVRNNTAGSLSEAIAIRYAVIKSVSA